MKNTFLALALSFMTLDAHATQESQLFLLDENSTTIANTTVTDVQDLVNSDELSIYIDRNSKFCFRGDVSAVTTKIKQWNKEGHFFAKDSGYELKKLTTTKKGIVGPKINVTIMSEVTGEIEPIIYILRCPVQKK